MLLLLNVWTGEGVQISLYSHIIIEVVIACTRGFVKDVIVTECVGRRRCTVVSLHQYSILKLIFLVLRVLLKTLLLQNVWIGEEGVRLPLYTHI